MRLLILLLSLPSALWAADFQLLKDDVALTRQEVVQMTERGLLTFYEGGQSRYSADGAYSYTYDQGATAFGAFSIGEDGVICIEYQNGRSRCDRFVNSHGRLVMLTEDGQRFAIRP